MPRDYITELDESPVYERCESFNMGMDAYTRSTLLDPAAYQYGLNTVVPDGMELRTRPGVDRLGATRAFTIQGMIYFDAPSPTPSVDYEQLIVCYNTVFAYWSGSAWVAMAGYTADNVNVMISADQGVDKVLFTDGVGNLFIWDGAAFTNQGNGPFDPPVTAGFVLWHANRMWAMNFPGQTAGKENDAIWGSNILAFGSGQWNGTDRNFRVGAGDGDAIVAAASLSSSFDKGYVMVVGKKNSIWLVNTDPTFPFTSFTAEMGPQQVSDGIGFVGKRCFATVGNDLYFISPDRTFRSLARMESAQGQYQLSDDLSLPLKSYVDRINWTYAFKSNVVKYKDYVLFNVPLDAATSPSHTFVFNERLKRWVGIASGWTNLCASVTRFQDVHKLVFGTFNGDVNQWKDLASVEDDATYQDNGAAIPTEIWTRAFLFGEPLNTKDMLAVEIRFGQSNAMVNVTLVCDDVDVFTWQCDVRAQGPNLEINLDFDLTADGNRAFPRGLRDIIAFNECYLKLSSTTGWFSLRNISLSGFVNALQTT